MLVAGKAQAFVQLRYSTGSEEQLEYILITVSVDQPQNRSPVDGSNVSGLINPLLLEKFQDASVDSEAIRQEYLIKSDNYNQEDFETLFRREFVSESADQF